MKRNLKYKDVKNIVKASTPHGRVVDEAGLIAGCIRIMSLVNRKSGPVTIQKWLDRMRQSGFLRMDGFKYFRVQA